MSKDKVNIPNLETQDAILEAMIAEGLEEILDVDAFLDSF